MDNVTDASGRRRGPVFIGKKYLEPTADGVVRIMEKEDHVRRSSRRSSSKPAEIQLCCRY